MTAVTTKSALLSPGTKVQVVSTFSRKPLPGDWEVVEANDINGDPLNNVRAVRDNDTGHVDYVALTRLRVMA